MSIILAGTAKKLPSWFKQEIPAGEAREVLELLSVKGINTICQEARCPNLNYCFKSGELTFLILGRRCSRNCLFCAVNKKQEVVFGIDELEPGRIAAIVETLALKYVVVTSVTRDDLVDGGAGQFKRTMESIHSLGRRVRIEVLIPDFKGSPDSLKTVIAGSPVVIGHNIETVPRLYRQLKPDCDHSVSLKVLSMIKEIDPLIITKSSLMLGLGEKEDEVIESLEGLRGAGCDIITLGQYLSPGEAHYPVKEFINPQKFHSYGKTAKALGFKAVMSGALVRSSYQAEKLYEEAKYA